MWIWAFAGKDYEDMLNDLLLLLRINFNGQKIYVLLLNGAFSDALEGVVLKMFSLLNI